MTPTPCSAASCESGASVARPDAAAEHHDVLPIRLQLEADAERTREVEIVARIEHRHAAGAAAFGLVEKFDLTGVPVDAVDAHRPAHPDLGAIGRRAEQVEHLPGIGLQRVLVHLEHDVLVFFVDRMVGDDGADELADQPLRIGIDVAGPQRGIGVFVAWRE